jgi:four helix bundle protein
MRKYSNYEVWAESHALVLFIYRTIASQLPQSEKYELTSQLKRAAYSIPFNIAEGCGRSSDKDFTHFLDMSLGSANELEYCILLMRDLNYLDTDQFKLLSSKVSTVKAKLINLIKIIRQSKPE